MTNTQTGRLAAGIAALALGAAVAGDAQAQSAETPFYGHLFGGIGVHDELEVQAQGVEIDVDTGFVAGAAAGMILRDVFRVEGEISHRRFDAGEVTSGGTVVNGAETEAAFTSFMVNALAQFGDGRLKPYVGGGVGISLVDTDDFFVNGTRVGGIDSTELAYQLIVGVGFALTDRADITADYRFHGLMSPDIEIGAQEFELEGTSSHNFALGLRYTF